MKEITAGLQDLNLVLDYLDQWCKVHTIVLLRGDLGSGKTTLVQHFCTRHHALWATSPTFTLAHHYPGGDFEIYHYDFYRKDVQELLLMGVLDHLQHVGVHFVEWGTETLRKILIQAGFEVLVITLERKDHLCCYRFNNG
ncbi:tRNA (adenosine(37)-N6)-threonylcarbamoyltransferase complex ATPase subunit type 1 TsaE [Helicobacter cynogastricus]|uniref:tRNA (adenosine(37)-N6)-threonylcarbamoyltransferase complex ATPase subunit type 1 TsaE n=1 Tax=Helicobacter cynogastricus TaxID=329937 RepID=UPI0018F82F03|nr:tRNA (adenosine(37)-N6)-threonylcarbamoyltransferase complex ATPase subunit type 1 TsaE [Helicobacter cynogastricus]